MRMTKSCSHSTLSEIRLLWTLLSKGEFMRSALLPVHSFNWEGVTISQLNCIQLFSKNCVCPNFVGTRCIV